ncbi:MAG: hypothetical protein HOM34_00715 [Planctomycetes bacterium]|jgi:imidazolonepropionase-like amidohydrolase|nr:hypothetical protein [Planctomycetota bacterium]MBT4027903.1 hypothetical protein [Planctomycetota bacterium]MBT4560018.1 hypothetical protein [Planctomycetota bacterium]MBT5100767.1 hypothetical protein [Planctomycetota bacterium]MBT5119226.1 hypothetical protein [Planctomycetota bacterium]
MILSLMCALAFALPQDAPGDVIVYKAAKVFTATGGIHTHDDLINRGMVAVQNGKIVWVGREADAQIAPDTRVVDLGDQWLVPGIVEPHSHIAGAMGDLNDSVFLSNPELHTHSVLQPDNPYVKDALAGGITTTLFIPGSGVNMSGFGMVVKMAGKTVEDVVLRSPGSLKVAQAGNPERYSWGIGRAFMNWNTRRTFKEGVKWAEAYEKGEAEFSPKYQDFLGLKNGTVPISVHTQIYQVVLTTLTMLNRDFGMKAFVDHGTFDGFKNAPMAAELGVPVMNGPRQFWLDRSSGRIEGCAAKWAESEDLVLGYNTDAPVVPQEELPFQAAMGVRLGARDSLAALRGITAFAADALLVEGRVGRLKVGLDADFAAWTGDPIDPRSSVTQVWIDGERVYDATEERRF